MNLMYYIIGENWQYYNQCYFSLYSFQQFNEINDIYIYTDAPHFFNKLAGRVKIIELDDAKKTEWRGEVDFSWRVKIKVIEEMAKSSPEPFIFADTDTFLYRPLKPVIEGVNNGKAYMHACEGVLKELKNTHWANKKMWRQSGGREFGGVAVTDTSCVWNSGIVALPAGKRLEAIGLAVNIADDMCRAGVVRNFIEQFAFSLALEKTYGSINAADSAVCHYWGNKPDWDAVANNFIINQYLCDKSFEESIEEINKINLAEIPYSRHRSNTKKRIVRLLDKLFPDKDIKYL